MFAHLLALSGPLSGRRVALDSDSLERPLTLGRHPSNQLVVPEAAISRHHCHIERDGARYRLRDLDSRHGTCVNDIPVTDRLLAEGDVLSLGASLFLVLGTAGGSEGSLPEPVVLDTRLTMPETATRLPEEGSPYLAPPAHMLARLGFDHPDGRALAALLAVARTAAESTDPESLARTVIEHLGTAVPTSHGAFLRLERDGTFSRLDLGAPDVGQPDLDKSGRATGDEEAASTAWQPAEAIVDHVVADSQPVLVNGLGEAANRAASSVSHAVICAPISGDGTLAGLLYLERHGAPYADRHLEITAAAAAIAGASLARHDHHARLLGENRRLRGTARGGDHGLVGDSDAMGNVRTFIDRVAPTDATVLVLGESGTGKEVVADAIHRASRRAHEPFVAINCATLTDELLSSELFGHERGAFTGAIAAKEGKIEMAHRGTLFLDEVGELPTGLQAKLLRVLEERRFERVGGTRPIAVDIRLIAATNRDLERAIAAGTFRADLFYRLNVVSVALPPLRERGSDIVLLAHFFMRRHAQRARRLVGGLAPEARRRLLAYPWPGNVRELSNAVERAIVLGDGELLRAEDLPESLLELAIAPDVGAGNSDGDTPKRYHEALNAVKRQLIHEAVAATGGNITQAAARLDLHPNHLHRLIRNLGIREELG